MSKKPTAKSARTSEQNFRNNLVQTMRRHLFDDGESESYCLGLMQMLCAVHVAQRDGIDYSDTPIEELVEQLAVEVKPLACEIIERARKAGQP